jgi:hypothetical protein
MEGLPCIEGEKVFVSLAWYVGVPIMKSRAWKAKRNCLDEQ